VTLAEIPGRLMLHEAFDKRLINRQNASSLQGKHSIIAALREYWPKLRSLSSDGLAVLPFDEYRFQRAHALRERHGLMTNDSILLAAADVFGIHSLATNDSDFDAVDWITVYKPSDVP
jgi:predicted nucleic acid-binding protein